MKWWIHWNSTQELHCYFPFETSCCDFFLQICAASHSILNLKRTIFLVPGLCMIQALHSVTQCRNLMSCRCNLLLNDGRPPDVNLHFQMEQPNHIYHRFEQVKTCSQKKDSSRNKNNWRQMFHYRTTGCISSMFQSLFATSSALFPANFSLLVNEVLIW